MLLNKEQILDLPEGTKVSVFLHGKNWESDCNTVVPCIKVGDRLYQATQGFFAIDELHDKGYECVISPNWSLK